VAEPVIPDRLGPAAYAARRERESADERRPSRAYASPGVHDDPGGDATVLAATRALLLADTREDVARILRTAVHDLGGAIVPARLATGSTLPVDVSLGVGEPRVVMVEPMSHAGFRLAQHLPMLVEDALVAAARCDNARRQRERACIDELTGVATRAEIGPVLAASQPGYVVCLLDLDGFKRLNDTQGHASGDAALRSFGALLRASVRDGDFCGRYGGDEFVVVTPAPLQAVHDRMLVLSLEWARRPGHGTTVSIGIAVVRENGGAAGLDAADRAMYRAKRLGRARVVVDDGQGSW
jgi:diguanylate cyclase (GGDEF)-like protein